MLRYRRYRLFVILTVFAVIAFYHFSSLSSWRDATAASIESLKSSVDQQPHGPAILKIDTASSATAPAAEVTKEKTKIAAPTSLAVDGAIGKEQATTSGSSLSSTPGTSSITNSLPELTDIPGYNDETFGLGGKGRHEAGPPLSDTPPIHWSRMPDHFPVPTDSIIALPTAKPHSIPQIQFAFGKESDEDKAERESRLGEVKEAFQHSWAGYKKHAWLQDELVPVNGSSRNPFCSWGATLVDALDTLWIMGLEEEFTEATNAVHQIDFTTTPRNDIPLFETTIRYLGGLLSAYDLSGGKYRILLDKAIELADILMGSFDTPNRMPITYYFWKPTFASNPHRASTRTVMAELGSLSVEFTRLSQLTGQDRYYDAIAQIADELEKMQSETKIPGLWPNMIDASGCKKPTTSSAPIAHSLSNGPTNDKDPSVESSVSTGMAAAATPNSSNPPTADKDTKGGLYKSRIQGWDDRIGSDKSSKSQTIQEPETKPLEKSKENVKARRQLSLDSLENGSESTVDKDDSDKPVIVKNPSPEKVDCQAQGLASSPGSFREIFTFGGMADSTYEYLPKQFMLLGGLVPQYRKMYEKAIDVANKHLIFRPMIPDEKRDILVLGSMDATENPDGTLELKQEPEQSHLTCFAGAMWGIGAKIFGRETDLEIASKLTDGCVWAYESTRSGIMPETMTMIPCASRDSCPWNQTRWYAELDPYREMREQSQLRLKQADLQYGAEEARESSTPSPEASVFSVSDETSTETGDMPTSGPIAKRQLGSIEKDVEYVKPTEDKSEKPLVHNEKPLAESSKLKADSGANEEASEDEEEQVIYNPYPTHEEYVESRIKNEKIAAGVPLMVRKEYLLRPEAIESVFVMYRITGDKTWRDKGWKMFQAIQNATRTEWGYSAIKDVTVTKSKKKNMSDSMESFWLGETLKYFYLLFSPPDLVSLDEYVLNTEAHPFKRPR